MTGNVEPRWKRFEKIVAAIEKAIAPNAIVEHDVRLPSVSTGHRVQVDLLITQGRSPRQSRAIVEIQDRDRPVEINDFRGWVQKKHEVGVEQLYVVSKHEFPASIVEAVRKQHGPCVKLMTFRDVERGNWPFEFHLGEFGLFRHEVLQPWCSSSILTEPSLPAHSSVLRGRVFRRVGSPKLQSLEELAEEALVAQGHPSIQAPGVHHLLALVPAEPALWLHHRDEAFRVRFFIASYSVKRVGAKMPLSVARYQQVDHCGEPTWVAECEGAIEGNPVSVQLILTSDERGQFRQYTTRIQGFEQVFGRPSHANMLMVQEVVDDPP